MLQVAVAIAGYYGSMKLLASAIAPFVGTARVPAGGRPDKARLGRITIIPYVAAMVLACLAGALNPNGWRTMLTAGLPAAADTFGLTQMDHFTGSGWGNASQQVIEPIERSPHGSRLQLSS